jgi:transposase
MILSWICSCLYLLPEIYGNLTAVYVPSQKALEDRLLVRTRFTFVKELNRFKNRIKAILNFYGIPFPEEFSKAQSHWSNRFIGWLESINFKEDSATEALKTVIGQCKYLRQCLLDITRKIRNLSKTDAYAKNIKLLRSIKGIGLIISMVVLTELGDIDRFKNLDRLSSYIGLVPSTNSSGEKNRTGDITPRGHGQLRSLLVEASWVAIRDDPALMLSYVNYAKRMEPNKAIIRIAKKLLNRIRYVLKNKNDYVIAKV